jgi:hypothetical protein
MGSSGLTGICGCSGCIGAFENGFPTRTNPGAPAGSFSPAINHDIEVWRWIGAIRPGKPSGSRVDGANARQ